MIASNLQITLMSFGYKYGTPSRAHFIFDVRCLPNPYWVPSLQTLSGLDPSVQEYLYRELSVQEYIRDMHHFLDSWLPKFEGRARTDITIALGCTGGQHRSVYCVEQLKTLLLPEFTQLSVKHRDQPKWNLKSTL